MGEPKRRRADEVLYYVPQRVFEKLLSAASGELRAELFADLSRINALYMVALSGTRRATDSISSLDLITWLLLDALDRNQPERASALYLCARGQDAPGLFAALIALGHLPAHMLHTLGESDGLASHPEVTVPGVVTGAESLGMGISKAKGMISANRAQSQRHPVFVLGSEAEVHEGQVWEALPSAARHRMGELVVIVEHRPSPDDAWSVTTSALGTLKTKFGSFGWHVSEVDGNDLTAFGALMRDLETITELPKVVVARTARGDGTSRARQPASDGYQSLYRFHSGPPNATSYRRALLPLCERVAADIDRLGIGPLFLECTASSTRVDSTCGDPMLSAYSAALMQLAEPHPQIVVLEAGLGTDTGVEPWKQRHPERFVECGVAATDMVSQAGGMAARGALPLCHSSAWLLSARPNEQIYTNDTEHAKVIYVATLAGLLPGGPSHAHQAVRDIAALAAVPDLVMLQPGDPREVALALRYCVERASTSTYLRLSSAPTELPFDLSGKEQLVFGKGTRLRPGGDALIIAYGPAMLTQAVLAAERLSHRHRIEVEVVNLPWLNRVDGDWLRQILCEHRWLFTLDDHSVVGGQGSLLCSSVLQADIPVRVRCFGVGGAPARGGDPDVLRRHALDAESLCAAIARHMRDRDSTARISTERGRRSLGAA